MTKVEKVFQIWNNLEEAFEKSSKGLSRKEFLQSISNESSVIRLRGNIMPVVSENELDEVNKLLVVIADAYSRSKSVSSIDNLDNFVWNIEPQKVNLTDFSVVATKQFASVASLVNESFFDSYYTLEDDKSVKANILDPNSTEMKHFEDAVSTVLWLNYNSDFVKDGRNDFLDRIYAFLIKKVAKRDLQLPITFINADKISVSDFNDSGDEDRMFPIVTSKAKFHCKFKWFSKTIDGGIREEVIIYL